MRKYVELWILSFLAWFLSSGIIFAQLDFIDPSDPNITTDINSVVDTTDIDWNPLREGTYLPVQSTDGTQDIGIINQWEIQSYGQWQTQTLQFIKNIINYALGFLWLIALVIFIRTGIKVILAGSDDTKYKEAISAFKRVALAIGWIALSRFIVTFIFYVVNLIVGL